MSLAYKVGMELHKVRSAQACEHDSRNAAKERNVHASHQRGKSMNDPYSQIYVNSFP